MRKILRENIEWLLEQYKKELKLEEEKDINKQDLTAIECYNNFIIELEHALNISK